MLYVIWTSQLLSILLSDDARWIKEKKSCIQTLKKFNFVVQHSLKISFDNSLSVSWFVLDNIWWEVDVCY